MQPKSVLKNRKSEFDGLLDEEEILNSESAEDSSHPNNTESFETNVSVHRLSHQNRMSLVEFGRQVRMR